MKLLLSIKPKYVDKILSGEKQYELRKTAIKQKIDGIIIYATAPIKKIVAIADIITCDKDTPEKIWIKTFNHNGISKIDYFKYFANAKYAYALKLNNIKQLKIPQDLSIIPGINNAPQNWLYVDNSQLLNIEREVENEKK